nr:YetF domain-containing protein [Lewinella sp. W8]
MASSVVILTLMIIVVRIFGLRTFAKMSSIDFASTIAIGTILASVVMNGDQSLLKGAVAMVAVIGFQQLFSRLKRFSDRFESAVENQPLLLMEGPDILYDNLAAGNVTEADLMAKLREANVIAFTEVKAVVLETTGDISVLHGDGQTEVDARLLDNVRR